MSTLTERAARHAALSDPVRLALVDQLCGSDRSPSELRRLVGIDSNLLAHHLDVLEDAGVIERTRSSGDGRRRYVHLLGASLEGLLPQRRMQPAAAVFVCTRNSARSQLAAALWQQIARAPASSAGTHPADRVHRGAVAAARRAGLDISAATPTSLADLGPMPDIAITVCDQAHEELRPPGSWLHWSIPDPVTIGSKAAFDATVTELRARIAALVEADVSAR
jgi:protein-tyrosine-phosphatase/DNA-binding transcriptional ArsR family regulator